MKKKPYLTFLSGLGDAATIDPGSFLAANPTPTASDVAQFLASVPNAQRPEAAQALVDAGVDPDVVQHGLMFANTRTGLSWSWFTGTLTVAASAAATFHGYRRNKSVFWALVYGLGAMMFPIATTAVTLGQGWGKPKP